MFRTRLLNGGIIELVPGLVLDDALLELVVGLVLDDSEGPVHQALLLLAVHGSVAKPEK